jgi:hypothetical protein
MAEPDRPFDPIAAVIITDRSESLPSGLPGN